MRDALCQFEAQVVEVRDGLTDLYVEHRGAGPSLRMRRGEVIGELRLLGATEVHTPKRFDPVTPCHALYALVPGPKDYPRTTDSRDGGTRDTTETVGKEWDSSLCFALTGERADDDLMIPRKCQATALATNINADVSQVRVLRALARRSKDRLFPWGCEGATWLDHEGYPYYHVRKPRRT